VKTYVTRLTGANNLGPQGTGRPAHAARGSLFSEQPRTSATAHKRSLPKAAGHFPKHKTLFASPIGSGQDGR
jgi:hypothetical protein